MPGREVIEHDRFESGPCERFCGVASDIAGAAGHQDWEFAHLDEALAKRAAHFQRAGRVRRPTIVADGVSGD